MPEYTLRPAWPGADGQMIDLMFADPEAVKNPLATGPVSAAMLDGQRTFLVGLEDGREVAAIDLVTLEGLAWIGMAVLLGHRQRGVGTGILKAFVEEARAKGLRHLMTRFEEGNLGARQAFLNAGFHVESQTDGLIELELSLE